MPCFLSIARWALAGVADRLLERDGLFEGEAAVDDELASAFRSISCSNARRLRSAASSVTVGGESARACRAIWTWRHADADVGEVGIRSRVSRRGAAAVTCSRFIAPVAKGLVERGQLAQRLGRIGERRAVR